jgi:hypothetical protein
MEAPPTYQELVTQLKNEKQYIHELEKQIKELKQQLDKVNSAYSKAKKNEVMLTSVLQST